MEDVTTAAHEKFNTMWDELKEPVNEMALDYLCNGHELTQAAIVGQIVMEIFSKTAVDDAIDGQFSKETKVFLLEMADHMGPDWAQALYHAARFITRVA